MLGNPLVAIELTEGHNEPPQPGVLVWSELSGMLHDEGPLGKRETEASERSVAARHSVAETHQ